MLITTAAAPGTGDPNQLGQAPVSVPVTGGETPMPVPDGVAAVPTNEKPPATSAHQPIGGQSPNEGDSPRAAPAAVEPAAPDIAAIPDAQPPAMSQPAAVEPAVSAPSGDPTKMPLDQLEEVVGAAPAPKAETDQNLGTVAAGDTMQTQPLGGQSPNEGDSPQTPDVPPTAAPEVTAATPDQIIAEEFAAPPPAAAEPAAIPTTEAAAPPPVAPVPISEPVTPSAEVPTNVIDIGPYLEARKEARAADERADKALQDVLGAIGQNNANEVGNQKAA